MSEMVQYKGELKKIAVPIECVTLKEKAEYLIKCGYSLDYDDYENNEVYFNDCLRIKDDWYSYTKSENKDCDDIFEATIHPDGKIKYLIRYYNGGCCFEEAIEESLKRLEASNKKGDQLDN